MVDDSTEVLAVQPSNVKALFRRAKALLELKHFDRSLRDILLAEQVLVPPFLAWCVLTTYSTDSPTYGSYRRAAKRSGLFTNSCERPGAANLRWRLAAKRLRPRK